MNNPISFSAYFRLFITDLPAGLKSEEAKYYKKTVLRFPEESVYVYSFVKGRLVQADGWEEVLGHKDNELNIFALSNVFLNLDHDGPIQDLKIWIPQNILRINEEKPKFDSRTLPNINSTFKIT